MFYYFIFKRRKQEAIRCQVLIPSSKLECIFIKITHEMAHLIVVVFALGNYGTYCSDFSDITRIKSQIAGSTLLGLQIPSSPLTMYYY